MTGPVFLPAAPRMAPSPRKRSTLRSGGLVAAGLVLVAGGLVAGGVGAQEASDQTPNPSLTFTFGSTFEVDDNRALDPTSLGTTTSLDNRLGLAYATETATSSFNLGGSAVLRFADLPGEGGGTETDFDDQTVFLRYALEGANSRLALSADYNSSAVAFFDPFRLIDDPETEIDEADLASGNEGTRITKSGTLSFETGISGPFGMSFSASRQDRDFEDTTDPDFFDTTRTTLSLGASLRPSERTSYSVTVSQTDYSAEDAEETDRLTQRASLGVSHALRPDMTLNASLGFTRIDIDETILGLRTNRIEEGANGSFGLTRDLPNGTAGVSLAHDITEDGDRTSLLFSRDLELPRGELSASLGPTFLSEGDTGLTGTLSYGQELPRGRLSASLNSSIGSNDDSDTVETTRLRLGIGQDLTPLSGVDLSIDYLDVQSDVENDDRTRARLRVAYRHSLAQDWQLAAGLAHTRSEEENRDTATSNSVFLSLERAFVFAP